MSPALPRLLITGGSGYLGSHLIRAATGWELWATFHTRPVQATGVNSFQLDLRDAGAVQAALQAVRPQAIIHTALSNADPAQIRDIPLAARTLGEASRQVGIRLVHVSTDLIWDGERAPYFDDSPPNPISPYGEAKAEAEAILSQLCPEAIRVRPALIWGLEPIDRQTRWLVDDVRAGKRVALFTDEVRCPVYVHDLCSALLELARSESAGEMNLGGPQPLNRWEFGRKLLAALSIRLPANVVASTIAESGLKRARDLTMISARAGRELKTRLRSVDEVLRGLVTASVFC